MAAELKILGLITEMGILIFDFSVRVFSVAVS